MENYEKTVFKWMSYKQKRNRFEFNLIKLLPKKN